MKIKSLFLIAVCIIVFLIAYVETAYAEPIELKVSSGNCPSKIAANINVLEEGGLHYRVIRETFDVKSFVKDCSFERVDVGYIFKGNLKEGYASCNSDTWFSTNTLIKRLTFANGKLRLVYKHHDTGGRWVEIPIDASVFNNQFIVDIEVYRN